MKILVKTTNSKFLEIETIVNKVNEQLKKSNSFQRKYDVYVQKLTIYNSSGLSVVPNDVIPINKLSDV